MLAIEKEGVPVFNNLFGQKVAPSRMHDDEIKLVLNPKPRQPEANREASLRLRRRLQIIRTLRGLNANCVSGEELEEIWKVPDVRSISKFRRLDDFDRELRDAERFPFTYLTLELHRIVKRSLKEPPQHFEQKQSPTPESIEAGYKQIREVAIPNKVREIKGIGGITFIQDKSVMNVLEFLSWHREQTLGVFEIMRFFREYRPETTNLKMVKALKMLEDHGFVTSESNGREFRLTQSGDKLYTLLVELSNLEYSLC